MSSFSEDVEDDEEMDWEEVDVSRLASADSQPDGPSNQVAFNIVLSKAGTQHGSKRRNANSAIERKIRHSVHRVHTLALLTAGLVRNRLINDPLLKARLLSLVPLPLINAFSSFSPHTHPLERDRSRLFDSAIKDLISWWWQSFEVLDSIPGIKSRTWTEAEALYNLKDRPPVGTDPKRKAKAKENHDDPFTELLESGEPIHGAKSLMKRAVMMRGSRDMSAQLFTSLLRALDVPARLVFSLQPVTWRGAGGGGKSAKDPVVPENGTGGPLAAEDAGVKVKDMARSDGRDRKIKPMSVAAQGSKTKPKRGELVTKAAKAAKAIKMKSVIAEGTGTRPRGLAYSGGSSREDRDGCSSPLSDSIRPNSAHSSTPGTNGSGSAPVPSSSKTPIIKLRKTKPPKPRHWAKSPSPEPDQMNRPPVFWTEVYSRPMKEWYCVDVSRKRMRCKGIMEPTKNNPENKMLYVIAFEEDNFIRDVTARYAHSFGAVTMKGRLPSKKNESDWFERATSRLRRPYKLGRDVKEDEEMHKAQVTEAMPTTVSGFKNHPNFALERHLRREEVIYPKKPIGTFRGDSVYPRSSVVICKSTESYMREGKRIKPGEQPLKMVKPRTVTINRKREEELLKMDGQEVALQGLYAEWQTELLVPPPIVDGIIPRNAYGNFDLFAPHMLPAGAKHLPYKGIAKTAKKLQVSYADAVVSFEFHKRRAAPVIDGIIVPELEAEFVLDAYWTSEEALEERELAKLQERCLKRWKKLIIGLRIKQRLQEEYRSRTAAAQKNTDGVSELRDIGPEPEPEETSVPQYPSSGVPIFEPGATNTQFELYADHHINTLSMPGPSRDAYVDGYKRELTVSDELEVEAQLPPEAPLKQIGDVDKGSQSIAAPQDLDQREARPNLQKIVKPRRSGRNRVAGASKIGKRAKFGQATGSGGLDLPDDTSILVDPEVEPTKKLKRRLSMEKGTDDELVLSSPLSSPPESPRRSPVVQSKRRKTTATEPARQNNQNTTPARKSSGRPSRAAAIKANENIALTSTPPSGRTLRPRK